MCVIYEGDCSCGPRYIGEPKRNADVRSNENNPTKSSEPSKHLQNNIDYCFPWTIISNAPNKKLRPGRNQRYHILIYGNMILTNTRTLKVWFHCHIAQLMTSYKHHRRKCIFPFFQFIAFSVIALVN